MKCGYCGKEIDKILKFQSNAVCESVVLYFCRDSACFSEWIKKTTEKLNEKK